MKEIMNEDEFIAKAFHDVYEAIAPEFNYTTREQSAVAWANVPDNNRRLMMATVKELLNHGTIAVGPGYSYQNERREMTFEEQIEDVLDNLQYRTRIRQKVVDDEKNEPITDAVENMRRDLVEARKYLFKIHEANHRDRLINELELILQLATETEDVKTHQILQTVGIGYIHGRIKQLKEQS